MKIEEKISLIIPAYNEAKYIGRVLDRVVAYDFLDEIIVVNDGSTDSTGKIAGRYSKVNLINLPVNQGKGGAIAAGIRAARYDVLLFLDADLIGLKSEHLLQLLSPIIYYKRASMTLGVFGLKEINSTNLASRMFPAITGQRAIRRQAVPNLSEIINSRYGVDLKITRAVPRKDREIVKLEGLSQIVKEHKTAKPMKAVKQRLKMYSDIAIASRRTKKDESKKL